MPSRLAQVIVLVGLTVIVLVCIALAIWLADLVSLPTLTDFLEEDIPTVVSQATAVPTFTTTATPLPPTFTPTDTPSPLPTATAAPTNTPLPLPTPTVTLLPPPTNSPTPLPAPVDTPTPTRPPIDFVVVHQRMRTNEENSWDGKVANNCGGDHSIYVQVVDAAGQPLSGVLVGDTYKNVRASSGTAGPGRLKIELWSNTMALEVQNHIDGTTYTSEQTLPLSTRDEDIPAEWLLAGGYCESLADCQLRQQTNGLCRGHYSYDVTFQRTW